MRLNETKSGINEIGIGLRISGRTSTHTSDKRFDRRIRDVGNFDTPPLLPGSAHCSALFRMFRSVS
jgi:hypothetical protein